MFSLNKFAPIFSTCSISDWVKFKFLISVLFIFGLSSTNVHVEHWNIYSDIKLFKSILNCAMYTRIAILLIVFCFENVKFTNSESHFTNTWAVEINGGLETAKEVAREHGYEIVRQVNINFIIHFSFAWFINIIFYDYFKYFILINYEFKGGIFIVHIEWHMSCCQIKGLLTQFICCFHLIILHVSKLDIIVICLYFTKLCKWETALGP